jgi:hypothetical protein
MRTAMGIGLLIVAWLRHLRARRPSTEWAREAAAETDHQAIVDMLILHSRPRLEAQLQDGDELVTKALGVLAIDVSALAVLVTVRGDIHAFWWLAGGGLVASGLLLLGTIWPREFSTGPDPAEFYEEMGGSTRIVASRQMLTELIAALDRNDPPLRSKNRLFKAGFTVLVVSILASLGIALAS